MRYNLSSHWDDDPRAWRNMVDYLRSRYGLRPIDEWKDSYKVIDEYLNENFCGRLDRMDHGVSCINFESEAHMNWFVMRFS